jgi:hypothetical protein
VQKDVAAKAEQGGRALAAGAIVLIQPKRALSIFAVSSSGGSGTAIPVDCMEFCRTIQEERIS